MFTPNAYEVMSRVARVAEQLRLTTSHLCNGGDNVQHKMHLQDILKHLPIFHKNWHIKQWCIRRYEHVFSILTTYIELDFVLLLCVILDALTCQSRQMYFSLYMRYVAGVLHSNMTSCSQFILPSCMYSIRLMVPQALEFRTPLFPHLVPPAIMVWIFVWKYIFEPFIHILQHFLLQISRSTNFCFQVQLPYYLYIHK